MDKPLLWTILSLTSFTLLLASCSQPVQQPATQPSQPTRSSTLPVTPSQESIPMQTAAPTAIPPQGETNQAHFDSALLKREFHYYIYLPPGYQNNSLSYPVVYLLHGRGENMSAWARIPKDLEPLFAAGELPPFIAVMPDFSSQSRAGYYIDSLYTSSDSPGEMVESSFFSELIPHIDQTYRTIPARAGRVIAGYSMGGYGAMRYLLAHPQVFFAGIALSPAVYSPLPPLDSSTREFGAFGKGAARFDEAVYNSLNYEAVFPAFTAARLKSYLFIAVGDDEFMNPNPQDAAHDLDFEAHLLYNKARRVENLVSELRVYDGAHTWDVWRRGFLEGMRYLVPYLSVPK